MGLDFIRCTPTASLSAAFKNAKDAATGKRRTTTFISVSLVDVQCLEHELRGTPGTRLNFGHVFTVAIGPEGVVIWQARDEDGSKELGYRLDERIDQDGDRVRSWKEGEDFTKFTAGKVNITLWQLSKNCGRD